MKTILCLRPAQAIKPPARQAKTGRTPSAGAAAAWKGKRSHPSRKKHCKNPDAAGGNSQRRAKAHQLNQPRFHQGALNGFPPVFGEWTETAFFALAKGFLGISFSLSQRNSCPHLLQFTIEPSAEEGTLICRLHCGQFRFTGLQYARFSFFCNTCLPNFPLTMYPAKICKKLPSAPISIISPFHFDSLIFF
ncbi:hypothetical protein M5E88_03995 [Akkermansia muciniphila]|nr:hypothetical protein M5E88_03995 [Akkermansia muciniphila]